MELVMIFALSVAVAILFNYSTPKFAASKFGAYFVGSYLRVTFGTALVFFFSIWIASILLSATRGGRAASLPSTSAPTA